MNKYIEAFITVESETLSQCIGYRPDSKSNDYEMKCRCGDEEKCKFKQAVNTIQELVEKEIPKKIIELETEVGNYTVCPNCHEIVNDLTAKYCSECGQKLQEWI